MVDDNFILYLKKINNFSAMLATLFIAALLFFLHPAPLMAAELMEIHGSDTMVILNRELAAEYMNLHPEIEIKVSGGGSNLGITALMEGRADIAAASRKMRDSEIEMFVQRAGAPPREIVVAQDGIGIYVHNNNPVHRLTMEQLGNILTGRIRNWREVGGMNRPIHIYNRDKNSGTRVYMQGHVLKDQPFSSLARDVSSTAVMAACVARNQGAMGYGGIAYSQGAHIIRLAKDDRDIGVWPSHENVASGKYPLSRPLHFYVNPNSLDQDVQHFLDWIRSPRGQGVVKFVGYYPAPGSVEAAPPETAGKANSPSDETGPILVTPENAERHGFVLDIVLKQAEADANPEQVAITLRFSPAGHTIERIQAMSVRIGDDVEIPLHLAEDLTARFTLNRELIDQTAVHMSEAGLPEEGDSFVISLIDFVTSN